MFKIWSMWSLRHLDQGRILRGRAEKQAMQASLENIMNVCEIEKRTFILIIFVDMILMLASTFTNHNFPVNLLMKSILESDFHLFYFMKYHMIIWSYNHVTKFCGYTQSDHIVILICVMIWIYVWLYSAEIPFDHMII